MRWKNSIRLRSNEAYLPERRKVEKIFGGARARDDDASAVTHGQ